MSSNSIKDTDSPSASTYFLPRFRNSRRGSIASLASTTQLDKDNLSQALDQIHSTASQSDTLTTFNEFTSPPSYSLGPDSRGIAGELQGGLSGLYTRLRASVGNVKDIVNLGGEDAVGGPALVKSPRGAIHSPAPSTKSGSEHFRAANSFVANVPRGSVPESEQDSPVGTKFSDPSPSSQSGTSKHSNTLLGSVTVSSKSESGSIAALKKVPTTLTQAIHPTIISPTLVEVNISAVKQVGPSDQHSIDTRSIGSGPFGNGDENATAQKSQGESLVAGDSTISVAEVGAYRKPGTVSPSQQSVEPYEGGVEAATVFYEKATDDGGSDRSHIQTSEDTVQPFPRIDAEENDGSAVASSSDGDDDNTGPPRMVTTSDNHEDDVFPPPTEQKGKDTTSETIRKGSYQHLEIPLRKGIAPQLITSSHSISNLSTASSSETNINSVVSSPLQRALDPAPTKHNGISDMGSGTANFAGTKDGLNPDLKTLNVFSQVKNKLLDKEYWMKDENARDCFYCGDAFSTFRRKHHCSKPSFVYFN